MYSPIALTSPVVYTQPARRRRAGAEAANGGLADMARTLPMSVRAGFRVSAPSWMYIVGGGLLGGVLLGLPGAIGGALLGAFLTR